MIHSTHCCISIISTHFMCEKASYCYIIHKNDIFGIILVGKKMQQDYDKWFYIQNHYYYKLLMSIVVFINSDIFMLQSVPLVNIFHEN